MDLQQLIEDDRERGTFRVHRSTMTSPEFHQLELERIFLKCWLYVGHESEIPKPGDYLRRSVGGWPVMFVRGKDGVPRVFLNTCPHRGALVCRQDRGNANLFQCFYHAWTFNNQGELVGTPEEEGYAAGFDPKERSLVPPPRVENYRGMVFLSYNPEVESLVSYLGDARLFLDTFLDQAGKDRMRVLPGTYRVNVQANWKLMIENTADFYHVVPTHISFIHYLNGMGKRLASQQPNYRMLGISLGRGHFGRFTIGAKGQGYPGARVDPVFDQDTERRMKEFRSRLINRYGPDMESWTPERGGVSNFVVYPNLAIAHGMRAVRPSTPFRPPSSSSPLGPSFQRATTKSRSRTPTRTNSSTRKDLGAFSSPTTSKHWSHASRDSLPGECLGATSPGECTGLPKRPTNFPCGSSGANGTPTCRGFPAMFGPTTGKAWKSSKRPQAWRGPRRLTRLEWPNYG